MRQEVGPEHRVVVSLNLRFRVWGVNWAAAGLPRWGPGFGFGPRHWLTRRVLKWWLVVLYSNHCGLKRLVQQNLLAYHCYLPI